MIMRGRDYNKWSFFLTLHGFPSKFLWGWLMLYPNPLFCCPIRILDFLDLLLLVQQLLLRYMYSMSLQCIFYLFTYFLTKEQQPSDEDLLFVVVEVEKLYCRKLICCQATFSAYESLCYFFCQHPYLSSRIVIKSKSFHSMTSWVSMYFLALCLSFPLPCALLVSTVC